MIPDKRLINMTDEEFLKFSKSEFKGLPRTQRRQKERELQDYIKMMNQFTPKQLNLIEEVVKYGSKEYANNEIDKIIVSLDRVITAYLYIKNEEFTEKEILAEQKIITDLLEEDTQKLSNVLKNSKGDIEMSKKKIAQYEEEVRKVSEQLLESGVKQGQAIIILQDKFPTLSKAMLVNGFKKVKAEREVEEVDPEIVQAAEYIFGEDEKKEVIEVNTPKEVEKPVQAVNKLNKSNLKTIKKVVQGEFAEYTKGLNGVEVEGKIYKDVKEVDAEAKSLGFEQETNIKKYEADMKELENKISICKGNIRKIEIMAEEIKAVMIMSMA